MQELYVSNWEFRRVQAEIDEMKHKVTHSELPGPWADPQGGVGGGGVTRGPDLPGKLHVAVGVLINSSTDPLEEQLDSLSSIASRGRSVPPSVKYADDFKSWQNLPCLSSWIRLSGKF